jgi:hypothetical protein
MKKFRQFINESETLGAFNQASADMSHVSPGAHYIEDDQVVNRVNSWLGSMAEREFLNVESAVHQLYQKLQTIGVDFDLLAINEQDLTISGEVSMPITQFGGTFGKTGDESPEEITVDDGQRGAERYLKIAWERHEQTGTYKVFGSLV